MLVFTCILFCTSSKIPLKNENAYEFSKELTEVSVLAL